MIMTPALRLLALPVVLGSAVLVRADTGLPAGRLRVGLVQMAPCRTIGESRDRILAGISEVAAPGARVAVFPESALRGKDGDDQALVDGAIAAIRRSARERNVYVVFGGTSNSAISQREINWMLVVGPDGKGLLRYEKVYDKH